MFLLISKVFIFDEVQFINSFFLDIFAVFYLRNPCPVQNLKDYLLYFPLKFFILLALTFEPIRHFELTQDMVNYEDLRLSLCMWMSKCFQHHLLNRVFFPLWNVCTFVKNQLTINVRVVSKQIILFHWFICLSFCQ